MELVCWSWISGVTLGTWSRRTTLSHAIAFGLVIIIGGLMYGPPFLPRPTDPAAAFGLSILAVVSLLFTQLFLVVIPAMNGIRRGIDGGKVLQMLATASVVAMAVDFYVFHLNYWEANLETPGSLVHRFFGVSTKGLFWPIAYWVIAPLTRGLKARSILLRR